MARRAQSETVQIGLRVKEPLRARLEEAARARGVSVNAEVVRRVEASFEQDRWIESVFGSEDVFRLMQAVAAAMNRAGGRAAVLATIANLWRRTGQRIPAATWIDFPYAYSQAVQAATRVLEALRPPGELVEPDIYPIAADILERRGFPQPEKPPENLKAAMDRFGEYYGELTLGLGAEGVKEEAEALRRDLGRLAERLDKEREE